MYENGILLKKSQFNYTIQDEFGNILIYNFAKGMSSFCRIIKSDVEAYLLLINSSAIQFDSNN